MELNKIKSEIIRKFSENKNFLSSFDIWSQIEGLNYFSFKVSQVNYRYTKSNVELKILEEKISAGKLALMIEIPEIRLDDHPVKLIEIIQDVEIKEDGIFYNGTSFKIKKEFNTRNALNQKQLRIFDAKVVGNTLTLKLETTNKQQIELTTTI